ncbi:MAG: hypothetical protein R2824_18150 [Saprospiraceae bacterium]|nr:hypothetical protein [Lewinella sp.]
MESAAENIKKLVAANQLAAATDLLRSLVVKQNADLEPDVINLQRRLSAIAHDSITGQQSIEDRDIAYNRIGKNIVQLLGQVLRHSPEPPEPSEDTSSPRQQGPKNVINIHKNYGDLNIS